MEATRASCQSVNPSLPPQTTKPTPVSIANQRYFQWMARISHSLSPARSRNGSCWFAVSDQAEKNRPVKNVLLEKKGDCMRKVIVTMWVTLDGFIAGPNGEMDWVMVDDEM